MRVAPIPPERHPGPVLQDLDLALPPRRVSYSVKLYFAEIFVHTGAVRFLLVFHFVMFHIGSQTGGA